MSIANLLLEYIKVLVWPALVTLVIVRYHNKIIPLYHKSKVKLSLFGLEIETDLSDLQRSLTAAVGGDLEDRQWKLLEDILKRGPISVEEKGYKMYDDEFLSWIRPLRNAGLIKTLPHGEIIEAAKYIELTPLGKILADAKFGY